MIFLNRIGSIGSFGKRTAAITAIATATATASWLAYRAYHKHKSNQRLEAQARAQESAFENRFLKEYDELSDDPDAPVPPLNNHVRETTPQGDVIMAYDANRHAFCYYCDKRSVQFKYLEPVARKYVVEHGCKRLYIDFRKELAKTASATAASATAASATAASATAAKTAPKKEAPHSVFAQLKKYGRTKQPHLQPLIEVPQKEVTRYLYCGTLNEFVDVDVAAAQDHDFNVIKPIDYASYKKMSTA